MSKSPESVACVCAKPKAVEVVEDHFYGLFITEPVYSITWAYCGRCGLGMEVAA